MGFPWLKKEYYVEWLIQQHYLVQHSCRLLALTISKYGPDRENKYLDAVHHFKGEWGHDRLAKNDIINLGYDPNQTPMFIESKSLVYTQYYHIYNDTPLALAGYALYLELISCSMQPEILKNLDTVYTKKQTSFVRTHAISDQTHFPEGIERLENGNLTATERQAILTNLSESSQLYRRIIRKTLNWCSKKQKSRSHSCQC